MALDLDNAVSLRLLKFHNEQNRANAKMIAYEVSKIFGGGNDNDNTAGDPYADGMTEVW